MENNNLLPEVVTVIEVVAEEVENNNSEENQVTVFNLPNVSTTKKQVLQKTNNINAILYPVKVVETTEYRCISAQKYMTFVYPDGIKTKVNTCSDVYELVHNSVIFSVIRNLLLDSGIAFSESYEIINYSRFYGSFIIDGFDFAIGENDHIKPVLKVQHSYCGTTKYKINFGYFRLICSNGLVLPVHEMDDFNFSVIGKHTEKINSAVDELIEKVQYFINNAEAYTEDFKRLDLNIVPDVEKRIEEVLKACNIAITENSKYSTIKAITNKIESEMFDLYLGLFDEVSDWLIYNSINWYIYNEYRTAEAPELKENTDAKVLQYIISTSKPKPQPLELPETSEGIK